METTKALVDLAEGRASATADADWRRAGGPQHLAAIAPDIAAARARIADRRALAGDGSTLPAFRAALEEIDAVVAALGDVRQRDPALSVALRDYRALVKRQIAALTDDIGRNAALVEAIAEPTLEQIRAWARHAFLDAQRIRLASVLGATGIRELLTDELPHRLGEIRRRLSRAGIAPPPSAPIEEPRRSGELFAESSTAERE
jgi:hypothetical protein